MVEETALSLFEKIGWRIMGRVLTKLKTIMKTVKEVVRRRKAFLR